MSSWQGFMVITLYDDEGENLHESALQLSVVLQRVSRNAYLQVSIANTTTMKTSILPGK